MSDERRDERNQVDEDAKEDLELSEDDAEQVSGGIINAWPSKLTGPGAETSADKK